MHDAITVISGIILHPAVPEISFAMFTEITFSLLALLILFSKEIFDEFGISSTTNFQLSLFKLILLAAYILLLGVLGGDQFIYFQF